MTFEPEATKTEASSQDRKRKSTELSVQRRDSDEGIPAERANRRRQVAVMFTQVPEEDIEKCTAMVKGLGGTVLDDVSQVSECTHLIVGKCSRTLKFLAGLASGAHIVSLDWLNESNKSRSFMPEKAYVPRDKQTKDFERLHAFNLESSATRAKEKRVFEGLQVLVTKSPAGKMAEKDVSTLVRIGGGEVVSKETSDCVMVSDRAQKCKPTTTVYNLEFVLLSILRQELASKDPACAPAGST